MANTFRRMFFDIETSYCEGWFWRPQFNTNIDYTQVLKPSAIICVCWKWEGSKKIHHLEWSKGNDKELSLKFYETMLTADEVVGHNGDKFDLRWLNTRYLIHGITSIPKIKSIDTLKIARKNFKFSSNRLDAIGKELGFGGKIKHDGIDMWHNIIQRNSRKSMADIVRYCKRDVDLLEKIYHKLEGYEKPKTHVSVAVGNEKWGCPRCASPNVRISTTKYSAVGVPYTQMQCNSCKKYYSIAEAVRKRYVQYKDDIEKAKKQMI